MCLVRVEMIELQEYAFDSFEETKRRLACCGCHDGFW